MDKYIVSRSVRATIFFTLIAIFNPLYVAATQADVVDPDIFSVFIRVHESLQQEINKRNLESSPRGQTLRQGAMSTFGLSNTDFTQMGIILNGVSRQLAALHQEAIAYKKRCESNKQPLDISALRQFTTRRQQTLNLGLDKLRRSLSSSGWQNLKTYLNDQLKLNVRKKETINVK